MNTIVIEVFRTNVTGQIQAESIKEQLLQCYPGSRITFDLDDCDKVLRIEGKCICTKMVCNILVDNGFTCTELE